MLHTWCVFGDLLHFPVTAGWSWVVVRSIECHYQLKVLEGEREKEISDGKPIDYARAVTYTPNYIDHRLKPSYRMLGE